MHTSRQRLFIARAAVAAPALLLTLLLSLAAPRLSAKAATPASVPAANNNTVLMEKLEVNAPRTHWQHAQSAHFEILSNLDDTQFVADVARQAGQIITLYEKACPAIFTPRLDLPSKFIFIQDRSTGFLFWRKDEDTAQRFFAQSGGGRTKADFDERMAGAPFYHDVRQFQNRYLVSALANHNDEQIVIVKFLAESYVNDGENTGAKPLKSAADLAVTCLNECALIHANGKKLPWLTAALNSMRGHPSGGIFPLQPWLADNNTVYKSDETARVVYNTPIHVYKADGTPDGTAGGSKNLFYRTGWIGVNRDNTITLGRYCLYCESAAIKAARDFPGPKYSSPGSAYGKPGSNSYNDKEKKLWANFMSSPDASLGDVFNNPFVTPDAGSGVAEVQRQLTLLREARDFLYYCLFGPDPGARRAFAKFVRAAAAEPVDETLFKNCFGAGYDEFRDTMYAYFQKLAKDSKDGINYTRNPWGQPGIRVPLPPGAASDAPIELRSAKPGEATRIISDWFDICGTAASSHDSLLQAYDRFPQAAADPQYIATLALNEARYGDRAKAIALLEKAASAKVARPNVYRTLARLRLEDILARKGADYRLALPELRAILDPLTIAFNQPQPNPENYILFAAACDHTDITPDKTYQTIITEGCRRFPDNIAMLETLLPALAKRGFKTAAVNLAKQSAQLPLPPEKKQQLETLLEMLKNLKPD